MNRQLLLLTSLWVALLCVSCTGNPRERSRSDNNPSTPVSTNVSSTPDVNFFIEGSGSMKGYFSTNRSSDLEVLLQQYYDRLTEDIQYEDLSHFFFIHDKMMDTVPTFDDFMDCAQKSCTSSTSQIDQLLKTAMEYTDVNIFVSDFGYVARNGNPQTARSQIRNVIAKRLKDDPDMAVVIRKYNVGFIGKYYPGSITCNQQLPVYFWIFGDKEAVKHIADLDIENEYESQLVFQANLNADFKFLSKNSRMIDGNTIISNKWEKDARNDKRYHVSIEADLSDVILSKEDILDIDNYKCELSSSSKMNIDNITYKDGVYVYDISIDRPSPCDATISYQISLPDWVEESNFSGSGIPPEGQTLNIEPQISGAYDAYKKFKSLFSINFSIK